MPLNRDVREMAAQETWTAYEETGVYALEETNWLKKIRGRPNELYLSVPDNGEAWPTKRIVCHFRVSFDFQVLDHLDRRVMALQTNMNPG